MASFTYSQTSGVPGTLTGLEERGAYTNTLFNRNFGTIGGSCHQRRLFLPFGGQYIRIRFVYEAPQSAASWEVNSWSVASGRLYSEVEPKDSLGSPVVWQSGTILNTTAGSATANSIVETYTPWYTVYVLPDPTFPTWGTVIMRSKNTVSLAGQGRVFTGSTGKLQLVNAVAQRYQDTYEFAAAATATNSNTFTLTSSADPADVNRNITAFQYQIEPIGRNFVVASSGDSRQQGEGSTGNLYGWLTRSCEAITIQTGVPVGFENQSLTASSHATFGAMALDRLSKTGRKQVDLFALQAGSTNDTNPWTADTIAANMARNLEFASTCRANGVQPAFVLMYPSLTATTSDLVANWRNMNNALLRSGVPCFDFYNQPVFTDGAAIPALPLNQGINADTAHLNDAGHNIAAQLIGIPGVRSFLGI